MRQALERMINGKKEERAFLAERSFLLFVIYYFPKYLSYKIAPFHRQMATEAEELLAGEYRELVWMMFRESGKTSFAKILLIWIIVFKKKRYLNVDSYSSENAERILFDIAFELTKNDRLIADYGQLYTKKRTMDDMKQNRMGNFLTENGIRIEAYSTQESVRGRAHGEQRPDFLLMDDFETSKTVTSEPITRAIQAHIEEFQAGLAPGASILYLCNYISRFANVQKLLDRSKEDKGIRIHNVPIIQEGKLTWEDKYVMTDEELTEGKVSIEDKRRQFTTRQFNAELMNNPIDESTQVFLESWFVFYDIIWDNYKEIVGAVDPSMGKTKDSDFSAIIFLGKHKEGFLDVLVADVKRRRPDQIIQDLFNHARFLREKATISKIGIESVAFQEFFQNEAQKQSNAQGLYLPITKTENSHTKKQIRIESLQPLVRNGVIRFLPNQKELLDQMIAYPLADKKDAPDALEMAVRTARKPKVRVFNKPQGL